MSVDRTRAASPCWLRGGRPTRPSATQEPRSSVPLPQHQARGRRHFRERGSAAARPGGTRALRAQRPAPPCAHVTEPGRASAARRPQRCGGGAPFPPPRRAEQHYEKVSGAREAEYSDVSAKSRSGGGVAGEGGAGTESRRRKTPPRAGRRRSQCSSVRLLLRAASLLRPSGGRWAVRGCGAKVGRLREGELEAWWISYLLEVTPLSFPS